MNHPTKSQLRAQFDKCYYSVGLTPTIDKLYEECFFCSTQKKIPENIHHATKTEAKVPGTNFHCDVIRRQSQKILIIRDHCSSLTAAKIIKSESHKELKNGIIDLVMLMKLSGKCEIRNDQYCEAFHTNLRNTFSENKYCLAIKY